MSKTFVKSSAKLFCAILGLSLVCMVQAFSKPKKTELIKEEEGFYYGYGKASSQAEALAIAKKDLIETALTATLRLKNEKASRVSVSAQCASERFDSLKPIYPKAKDLTTVAYKVSLKDWEKDSKAHDEKLRGTLTPLYNSIIAKGAATEKLNKAAEILNILAEYGQADLLTMQADGTELFSRKVENVCQSIVENLVFEIPTANGFVNPETEFSVKVSDKSGAAVSGLSVKALWELPALSITTASTDVPGVVSVVKTDSRGRAKIEFPMDEVFKGKIICLTVSTPFSMSERATKAMRKLDAETAVEGHYMYIENLGDFFKSVAIKGGEYSTGSVPQDSRAGAKEKKRTVMAIKPKLATK